MKICLFLGKFEVLTENRKSKENESENQKKELISLLGMFQGFQNCHCFFSCMKGYWLLFFWILWKIENKNYKLSIFSKTKA